MRRINKVSAALLFSLSLCAIVAHAEDTRQWLDRMSNAMRTKSYAGTFVYIHNDKLETLHIEHRQTSSGVSERLLSLNGEAREIIRNASEVTCVYPKKKKVSIDKTRLRSRFPAVVPENIEELSKYYHFHTASEERIADKDSVVVNVVPKDQYRYGYRLWIDKETHLLVRSDVLDEKEQPIEKVMFTDLKELKSVPDEPLKHQKLDDDYHYYEVKSESLNQKTVVKESSWEVTNLPPGFSMLVYKKRIKRSGQSFDQMVFTDGMSTVSVFVDKHAPKKRMMLGASKMGAAHAYGRLLNNYYVTVVGEVPAITVATIARAVRARPKL